MISTGGEVQSLNTMCDKFAERAFDLSLWKIKQYFACSDSKILITHLTSKRTKNDPRWGVLWSTHQRLVIIKPSLMQTVFSFSSVKVGFK